MKRVKHRYDDALSGHSWQEVERLLADHYRQQSYQVEHCGTGATQSRYDGGIDLKLRKNDEYIVVQCKHWNALQVPHNDVHQLLGIMVNEAATGAVLVTSGEFTPYAKESANKLGHVQLIDGASLREMLGLPSAPMASSRGADSFAGSYATASAGKRDRPRSKSDSSSKAWLVFSAIAVITLFFLIRALLSATAWTAGESIEGAGASTSGAAVDLQPDQRQTYQPESRTVHEQAPELIDRQTGTIISKADGSLNTRAQTEAEIRESRRQADEAMKVIEATTPELE